MILKGNHNGTWTKTPHVSLYSWKNLSNSDDNWFYWNNFLFVAVSKRHPTQGVWSISCCIVGVSKGGGVLQGGPPPSYK